MVCGVYLFHLLKLNRNTPFQFKIIVGGHDIIYYYYKKRRVVNMKLSKYVYFTVYTDWFLPIRLQSACMTEAACRYSCIETTDY